VIYLWSFLSGILATAICIGIFAVFIIITDKYEDEISEYFYPVLAILALILFLSYTFFGFYSEKML